MKKTVMLVVAAGLLAGQSWAGLQITVKSVVEGDKQGRGQAQGGNSTMMMAADAEKARIDFKEGQGPGVGKGGYLVTRDAGKTFYMVSPEEKTYMKWDMESMVGMAGAMGNMMKMQVSDPKVEKLLDEAGETILGYPTRHYKFRTTYHMSMKIMGFKNEMSIAKDEEAWTTTKLDISALGAWFNKAPKTQNAELDKLIEAEKGKMTGIPLKMISVQTSTDSEGKASVSKTLMDVTEVKKIGGDDVSFEIPADYKEMNLFQASEQEEGGDQPAKPAKRKTTPKFDFGSMMKKAMESAE